MREILFRAYDKTMKRYKPFDGMHDTMTISREGKVEYYNLQNGSGFDEYILEQFTGLTDKNGKKIFEGDIVQIANNIVYVVRYCGDKEEHDNEVYGATFVLDRGENVFPFDEYAIENCKVIGNIHDNPELLT